MNVVTDINGTRVQLNEYDPWGAISRSEGTIDATHRFTGKELDPEFGLYYYGGRYYDAEIGRFISADPFVQEPLDPQNLNRYSYVLNSPQNYTDPSGYFHQVKKKKGGFFNSIFGKIFRVILDVVLMAVGLPPGVGEAFSAIATVASLAHLGRDIASLASGLQGQGGGSVPSAGDPLIPGLSNAGGGGFFSPALRLAAETGCDDCSDSSWAWQRVLFGLFRTGIAQASEEGEKPAGGSPPTVRRPPPLRPPGSRVGPTDYVTLPNGRVIPIPQGWQGRIANNGRGVVFQKPGSPGDANSIRIMDPNRQNPNGYVKLTDSKGNSLDVNGNKVSPNAPSAHIPLNYEGQIPALWTVYGR